jgi:nucleotide-binding universal stress UspA family protein
MKVLIALDATRNCERIVGEAASRPWPANTEFLLVHVLDPFPYTKAPVSLERAKKGAEQLIQAAAKSLEEAGYKVTAEVVLGLARKALPDLAQSWAADLVMVGSNETGALTRLLLGSTARTVLREAPCSVEIVRPQEERARGMGRKILVATDGSECSKEALWRVAGRPWPTGSVFKVISIPEPFLPLGDFPQLELKEVEELNTAAVADAERYAKTGAEILKKAGLEVTTGMPFPRENDARKIVEEAEAWKADLVVVGSHGRRGFERWTLGSVSEHVALDAPCTVEVVRTQGGPN